MEALAAQGIPKIARAVLTRAKMITRTFEEFVVRETRTLEAGLMILRFEVDEGGRTLRASETYRRR